MRRLSDDYRVIHVGGTHQPDKVAAALVHGLRAQINVAGEAVLHEAVLRRLKCVPRHREKHDEDHEGTNSAACELAARIGVVRATAAIVAVLLRTRHTHATVSECAQERAVAQP